MKNNCLIISDGTKGMENQSIAIAKQLKLNFVKINLKPNLLLKIFPISAHYFYFILKNKINFVNDYSFSYVITTGKRMCGFSILIKKKLGNTITNIHLQKPNVNNRFFDILILPEHDNTKGKNIFQIEGALSFFKKDEINHYYKVMKENLKNLEYPTILLLLGGSNKRYNLSYTDYCIFLLKLKNAVEEISGNLIISTSRRTPEKVEKIIRIIFKNFKKHFYLFNEKEKNIYPGILKITDFVVVTSDSVNMISEVATTKIPLFIGFLRGTEKGKLEVFNEKFFDKLYSRKFETTLFPYNKKMLVKNDMIGEKINNYLN